MFASIGQAILRYCGKAFLTMLWSRLISYIQNLIRSEAAKKKADKNSKEYEKPQTPDERDKNAEDLLNRD